jgi:PAS domain S-box-containing protein
MEQFPAKNPNPVLRAEKDGTVLYSNVADEPLLHEWSLNIGEKLPLNIGDLVQRVISKNIPEKVEVKAGNITYFLAFHHLPEEESVNIYGFNISEHKELEEKFWESKKTYSKIVETNNEDVWLFNTVAETACIYGKMDETLGYNHSLIEACLDPLVAIGYDGKITDLNKATEKVTGYSRNNLIGTDFSDYFTEPEKARIGYQQVFKYGEVREYPLEIQHKDGHITPVLYNASVYRDKNGKVLGVFATARDITEHKKAKEGIKKAHDNLEVIVRERTVDLEKAYKRLEESEKGLAEAQRMAHIGNWDWNIITNELYLSDEVYRIYGYKPQEFSVNRNLFLSYVHPDDRAYVDNTFNKVLSEKAIRIDYRIILANGEERVIHAHGEVIYNKENIPIRTHGTLQDITELKKAEEKIKNFANVVESSNDAIITKSLDEIIISWNRGADQIYGYLAGEVLGKNLSILEPDNIKGEIKRLSNEIKQGKKVKNYETLRLKKDGTLINISLTLSPVFDSSGELVAISSIGRDITEKKIAEELRHENQMVEVANRTKSDFLVNMSHELRTPLNSIIGFSDMLQEQMYGELNEKQLKYVENISISGKHLLNLINNILDISKVEAGKMELKYKKFELETKLNVIRSLLSSVADRKNIKIEIEIDSNLTSICVDEDKFIQIMYNLVDNAIKFSYEKSLVEIKARKKGDMMEIAVTDTGIGIKNDDQHKLFKPFSQIDSFYSRKTPGTGLGLSLVKQIVDLHGGYVWFRSNPNKGSIFAFVIPINNSKENC